MRIKKQSQTTQLGGNINNDKSNSIKDTYSCDYINKTYDPQAIFCTLKADTPITQNYTALTNWQVRNTVGTELSVGTNGIVIGKNINNVEVTCKTWVSLDPSGLYYTFICVNGDNISYTWQIHYVVANQAQCVFNQAIIPVQEGDYVSFKTYGSGSVASNTSIIVKKID